MNRQLGGYFYVSLEKHLSEKCYLGWMDEPMYE